MRTIAHLSDLHFGKVDPALVEPLLARVRALAPDLVVVSGDLTQRATEREFRMAREFLDKLPQPLLAVPGNHDVPFNPVARLLWPLARYRRHIDPNVSPIHIDSEMAALGINSARSWAIQHGSISPRQAREVKARLSALPPELVKIVVSHHPFGLRPDSLQGKVIKGALHAMGEFGLAGVDLLLSGHVHMAHSSVMDGGGVGVELGLQALVVSAGTTTSTRRRGESNAFNAIRVEKSRVEIDVHRWSQERSVFEVSSSRVFARAERGWRQVGGE